jgi:hypothetical protein
MVEVYHNSEAMMHKELTHKSTHAGGLQAELGIQGVVEGQDLAKLRTQSRLDFRP